MKFISDRDELIHIIEAAAIRATVEATRVLAPDMHTKPDAFHYPTTLVVVFSKYVSISTAALPSAASLSKLHTTRFGNGKVVTLLSLSN